MRRGFGKMAVAAMVAFGAFGLSTLGAGTAAAFDQVWAAVGCVNVPAGQSALWDDSPSGGPPGNEAAFVWLISDNNADETCKWVSAGVGVNSGMFPQLTLRAAVNDNAILKLEARQASMNCQGGMVLGAVSIGGASDHSAYVTRSVMMAAGVVNEVCLTLTDDPNMILDPRTSALVDDIQIVGSGWGETFTGGGGD